MQTWILFTLATIVLWGLWGFLSKLATNHIDPHSILMWESLGHVLVSICVYLFVSRKLVVHAKGTSIGILTGITAALGFLFLVMALKRGPTTPIIVGSALYLVVTVALAAVFLKEPITIKHAIGSVFALVAIVLFSL